MYIINIKYEIYGISSCIFRYTYSILVTLVTFNTVHEINFVGFICFCLSTLNCM